MILVREYTSTKQTFDLYTRETTVTMGTTRNHTSNLVPIVSLVLLLFSRGCGQPVDGTLPVLLKPHPLGTDVAWQTDKMLDTA